MSPAAKYTLGRIGLFALVALALWPVDMNIFLKLMLALAFSAALAFFLLRRWREEMGEQMAEAAQRRRTEREKLRSALAGDAAAESASTPTPEAERPADGKQFPDAAAPSVGTSDPSPDRDAGRP